MSLKNSNDIIGNRKRDYPPVTSLKDLELLTSFAIVNQLISSHLAFLCPPSEERYIHFSEITMMCVCVCVDA